MTDDLVNDARERCGSVDDNTAAIIRDGIEVAERNVIGMGAVITRSTKPGETYLSGVNQLADKNNPPYASTSGHVDAHL